MRLKLRWSAVRTLLKNIFFERQGRACGKMFARVEELSAHPADAAELFDIENRDRAAGECDDAIFLERL